MSSLHQKILPLELLIGRFGRPRQQKLVFTNGCFDILHRGHVEYLEHARSLGEQLVVAVNSDRSVRGLKGPGRPLNPQDDRALVLAALRAVDAVTIFDDDTPHDLIRRLLPDVLVKGGDYSPENVVGAADVLAAGGRVEIAPLVPGRSTSLLIERTRTGDDA
ncbi:MAG: D-glycero-beta-D-manno-heptose 1-phosphate adenylyltransferase [Gemmatimonadota bacterium]